MTAIKIKRHHGQFAGLKKHPFRAWLDEQPRAKLTYRETIPNPEGKGWTTEDFVMESFKRGVDVRFGTTYTWTHGTEPKWMALQAMRKAFPGIVFGKKS